MKRRDFFLAVGAGAASLPAPRLLAQSYFSAPLFPIGLQLYTLRNLAEKDMARTLAVVAGAGYTEIEFAGYFGHPATSIRRMLDENGLSSPAAHVTMSDLGTTWSRMLDDAAAIGQRYLCCAWIDAPERTPDGYRKVAERFNSAAVAARASGIQLGYHNYSYEFVPVERGITGFEILMAECPPDNLVVEADVFWMLSAGQDPLAWFARFPGRVHMLHIKDMGPPPKNEMVDVGAGVIDWRQIIEAARKAGARHFFVEHDEPADPVASIRSSYEYLMTLDL